MSDEDNIADVSADIISEITRHADEEKAKQDEPTADWKYFTTVTGGEDESESFLENRTRLICDVGHEYYVTNAKKDPGCKTCNRKESALVRKMRKTAETIFEKPFSCLYPAWACAPDTTRKLMMLVCNQELKLVFDNCTKKANRDIRRAVCEKNKFLYIYVSNSNIEKELLGSRGSREMIRDHINFGYHGDVYSARVIEKLQLDVKSGAYGNLNHGELLPHSEFELFEVDDDFEEELLAACRISSTELL